jgi:hypothetical protein
MSKPNLTNMHDAMELGLRVARLADELSAVQAILASVCMDDYNNCGAVLKGESLRAAEQAAFDRIEGAGKMRHALMSVATRLNRDLAGRQEPPRSRLAHR